VRGTRRQSCREQRNITGHGWDASGEVGKVEAVHAVPVARCNWSGRADKGE